MTSVGALAAFGCALLAGARRHGAADVTYERLRNPEPQNWLTASSRLPARNAIRPLEVINKSNVKNSALFAVSLGGNRPVRARKPNTAGRYGFMYTVDVGVVYKIDVRSGTSGRRLEDGPEAREADRNRGVALWGNLVISVTGYEHRHCDDRAPADRLGKNLLGRPTSN